MAGPTNTSASARRRRLFGDVLRDRRKASGYSLRKFAELVGISPTYLSQVEKHNADPPTAERVKRMAELLDANADEWIALAGRVPDDLLEIIKEQPTGISELLREVRRLTSEELQSLMIHDSQTEARGSLKRFQSPGTSSLTTTSLILSSDITHNPVSV